MCGEKLLTENQLQRHIKLVHELLPHKCPFRKCTESYATLAEMDRHVDGVHPRQECLICKSLIQIKYMKTHMQMYHDKNNISVCDVCGKEFIRKTDLKVHKHHEHEGIARPECDICGRV